MTPITFLLFNPLGKLLVNETLSSKGVQELMKSKQKFDLILAENFLNEGINCGFSHFYKAPLIGIGTFMPNIWSTSMVSSQILFKRKKLFERYLIACIPFRSATRLRSPTFPNLLYRTPVKCHSPNAVSIFFTESWQILFIIISICLCKTK